MSEVERKKKNRKVLRTSFTKTANELDGLLVCEQPDISAVEIYWECLKPKFDVLRVSDGEIYDCLLESASEEELVDDIDRCDQYIRKFTGLRIKCEKLLQSKVLDEEMSQRSSRSTDKEQGTGKRKFKLPNIEFKHYDGNIKGWLSFWAQFKKIHEDPEIDDNDKIEYLLQATIPGSRARQLVESFPAMSDNYQKIIDCMQARFGQKDLQIEVYVRELLKLVLSNAISDQHFDVSTLYDRIETQLRALETLGITSDNYSAMLFPLIESCLPENLLRIWQRSSFNTYVSNVPGSNQSLNTDSLEIKLKHLMNFLRVEVENEQRVTLANEGFGLRENHSLAQRKNKEKILKGSTSHSPTAAGLFNAEVTKCVFCSGLHLSEACFKAQKMSFDEKKNLLYGKKACFHCLRMGHQTRKCHSKQKCVICGQAHVPLMCPDLEKIKRKSDSLDSHKVDDGNKDQVLANQTNTHIYLQTLRVAVKYKYGIRMVRALVDTGSQRSYILKSTANALGLSSKRVEKITHCLFGGSENTNNHYCYDVTVTKGNYIHTFDVLDQSYICNEVSSPFYGPWTIELERLKIDVSDINNNGPIELLLGADVAEMLYTGKSHNLECGLVAVETRIGWTIMGKFPRSQSSRSETMTVLSLFVNPSITELWQLDVLGIQDPTESKSKDEMALEAKELFLQTVSVNAEERYEVALPWVDSHPPLPTNYTLAKKRLDSTVQKLKKADLFYRYDEVFKEWKNMNIMEIVPELDISGHFLPHRPVLKAGPLNIADLPSRGCSPKQLYESKWWEGPSWLYKNEQDWPCEMLSVNEDKVLKERKKKLVSSLVNDNAKRIEWPIGRVIEVFPGKDKLVRLVRVKTIHGDMLRPVQRVFPLEFHDDDCQNPSSDASFDLDDTSSSVLPQQSNCKDLCEENSAGVLKSRVTDNVKFTRSGRVSKIPRKYLETVSTVKL